MPSERGLEATLRRLGLARATDLQAALGLSQATVSRALAALGERVVRVGRARAARYALAAPVGTFGSRWPLFALDAEGRAEQLGELSTLAEGRCWFEPDGVQPVLLDGGPMRGLFDRLPWYLHDLRPQGFLGKLFAQRHAASLGAPREPELWRDDQVLAALLGAGHDLPGDLILGEPMLQRAQGARLDQAHAVEERQRGRRYPALAALALAGEWVGSPCGGEQPKFGYCVRDAQGGYRHVLVKFTAAGESPAKRRWCDLLLAEHHAAEALHAHGIAAARSHIVPGADRLFLEVARFDRVGEHGRRGCVSLAALAQAAPGERDDWRRAGANLWRGGWISREDATTLTTLYWFGALIANDDMHLGNVSFVRRERHPLALAPAYDMLPMRYRPAATGEIVARPFNPPLPPPTDLTEWSHARAAASECWQRIAAEARVSDSFREIARENAARLAHAQTQLR